MPPAYRSLGRHIELDFALGVNVTGQIGRTFDVFDWAGVYPAGAFTVSSPYTWDLSQLYTTGDVTLYRRARTLHDRAGRTGLCRHDCQATNLLEENTFEKRNALISG